MDYNQISPMSLRLPLCPKCGETDKVTDQIQMMINTNAQYTCNRCNIVWFTSGQSIGRCDGTIIDENQQWHHLR